MSESSPSCDRAGVGIRVLVCCQLAALCGLAIYLAFSQRHLYADGAYQFSLFVEHEGFHTWLPARRFAHWLTQAPAWVLLRGLACRDLLVLSQAYGLTLFLTPVAGLALTWWAAREAPAELLLPPLIATELLFLTTSFVMFHEGWVTVAVFWPVLYLLLFTRRLTWLKGAMLLAGCVLLSRTYESYLFLAGPIAVAAGLRWRRVGRGERGMLAVCLAIVALGAALSLQEILHPTDVVNRTTFQRALAQHLTHPPVWFSLAALSAWCWVLLSPPASRIPVWIVGVVSAGGALLVALSLCEPGRIEPEMQYVSRVQLLYVPWLLGCGSIWRAYAPARQPSRCSAADLSPWVLSAAMTLVACGYHAGATREWNRFRTALRQDLERDAGVIPFRESHIDRDAADDDRLSQFAWSWAMPTLSAVLSAVELGHVGSLVDNAESVPWQPFDPHDPMALRWCEHFGVEVRWQNWRPIGSPPPATP